MELIILAAGRGSRLHHITNDKPKHLLEINGLSIIERIIKMIGHNFSRINIVTGYMKESFNYIADKFDNISISYNKKWETTETKGSFLVGYDYLKLKDGAFLINGDSFIFNKMNFLQPKETTFYYSENYDADEWVLELNNDRVSSIDLTGTKSHFKLLEIYYLDKKTIEDVRLLNNPNLFLSIMETGRNPLAIMKDDIKDIDTLNDIKYATGLTEEFQINKKTIPHAIYKSIGVNTKDFKINWLSEHDFDVMVNGRVFTVTNYTQYKYEEFKLAIRRLYDENS